ncbi:MAG: ABC transporter permease [Anaerolineae bacterium]|nr:ABC transporter permease [Anaerolineae bacterium]
MTQSRALRRLLKNRAAKVGLGVVFLTVIAAVFAPFIAPYDPIRAELDEIIQPPSGTHLLGTDELGRDILSRIIYGSRISLTLGIVSVGIGLFGGIPLGMIGAYWGGWADLIIMRLIDILLAFPAILLAIVVVSILGPGLYNAMIAVGISQLPIYARLVRGVVLSIKEKEFVEAAKAVGAGDLRIISRHILPNSLAPIIVQATLNIASAILSAAALGFLGLGAQPPTPEWGTMLSKGRLYLRVAPHVTTFPGLAIVITVLGFNLFGDGLRDALDPRMTRGRR